MIKDILAKEILTKDDIIKLLSADGEDLKMIFEKSSEIKEKYIGRKVYLRGLIELSNICAKNCYYCGIRRDNKNVERYLIKDDEVLEAARFALKNNYGSIVIQTGELQSEVNSLRIETLVKEIIKMSDHKLGITLSCGEQTEDVYKRWFEAGAHRYLLRIETTNKELYQKLHPNDDNHSFEKRLECLQLLKKCGYQVGTGVMIGLPFQKIENLAEDLLFMQEIDIDMCGMGPYIEHVDTPLYNFKDQLMPVNDRFKLTLKMLAVLRIMMKDINMAATTALQAIDKIGREKAIRIGANILMPNITPGVYRDNYKLYENKPCTDENAEDCAGCIEGRIKLAGGDIAYGEWGDSKHFFNKENESV
ncbi:MAG: [FeFe] hydrogenase H-cluster radical SAM maturase HydE [Bacteroidetes bacterium GWF2_33_16]|nr:MAG: [FeFe] hydrogenase H-cluster radical SAM maturase HydE [Bacteroidetes bacterium GWE2_32_14]OFY05905.1 MAG: [FeFe] hydrogenase H-cluster radical SAM maturase HydE [Bacteroidetes bacterium GWF2_33_16]